MQKYTITAIVSISVYTEVEAKNEKDALRLAEERRDILNEDYQNADPAKHWCAGEYDGIPQDLKISNE